MSRTAGYAVAALAALVLVPGCGVKRELQEQFVDLKNELAYQQVLMEKQGEFLVQKVDQVNTKMDRLEASEAQLAREISQFVARPEQVKREILEEVELRSASIAAGQENFGQDFRQRREDTYRTLNRDLDQELDAMRATLAAEDEFFRFVFAYQDSMNQVFASRFDTKPWYNSIIARWDSQQGQQVP